MKKKDAEKVSLTENQLAKLNQFSNEFQLIDKDVEIAKLRLELSERELKLISANYTLKTKEVQEQKNNFSEKKNDRTSKNEKYKEFTKKIKDDLDLPERWGFDPITGEIIYE